MSSPHARDDRGARHAGKLDASDADTARGAVHQDPFPGPERALGEQGVMCDREGLGESARLQRVERVWHRQGGALVDDRQLGLGPSADDGHDPVAGDEVSGAGTSCRHDACEFEARDVERHAGWSRVQTRPLQQVGAD